MRGTAISELRLSKARVRERMPSTSDECRKLGLGESRPCPWMGCRYHLGLDGVRLVWDAIDPAAHACCALAVASERPRTPAEVAELLHCSIGLVEVTYRSAVKKIREALGDGDQDLDAAILQMRGKG